MTFDSSARLESIGRLPTRSDRAFPLHKYRPRSASEFVDGEIPELLLLINARVYAASGMANLEVGAIVHSACYAQLQMIVGPEPRGGNFSYELSGGQELVWRRHLQKSPKASNQTFNPA